MSKVVKQALGGRLISKVFKGVTKAIKKVASSKLGKILITAAAIYFGGAALMGGIGGATSAAAGSSFLSGASAGLSSAASGISGAWSALTGTGGLSGAASSLSSGFTGAMQAGAGGSSLVGAIPGEIANGMSQAEMLATQNAGIEGATQATNAAASSAFPAATNAATTGLQLTPGAGANPGLISKMMASQYTAPALISGTTQLIGGAMQGYGAQKQQEQQAQLAEDQRNRYNTNVGTRLFGA